MRDRPLYRILASLLLTLAILGPVEAAPRSRIVKSDAAAKIVLYDSLCDEDNSLECLIAEIGCDAPGDFTASVFGLNPKDAASVFAKGNGKGSLSVGGSNWTLQVIKVALSEYTFNWDVTTASLEKGREVWGAVWNAESVQLQVGAKKAVLRRSDVDEASFRQVVSTCGAAER